MDLNNLSLLELQQLQKDIVIAIERRKKLDREAALQAAQNAAAQMGFTLNELLGAEAGKKVDGRKGIIVKPKYRNPANPNETWTGRGREPKWVSAALSSGKTMQDLLIK